MKNQKCDELWSFRSKPTPVCTISGFDSMLHVTAVRSSVPSKRWTRPWTKAITAQHCLGKFAEVGLNILRRSMQWKPYTSKCSTETIANTHIWKYFYHCMDWLRSDSQSIKPHQPGHGCVGPELYTSLKAHLSYKCMQRHAMQNVN